MAHWAADAEFWRRRGLIAALDAQFGWPRHSRPVGGAFPRHAICDVHGRVPLVKPIEARCETCKAIARVCPMCHGQRLVEHAAKHGIANRLFHACEEAANAVQECGQTAEFLDFASGKRLCRSHGERLLGLPKHDVRSIYENLNAAAQLRRDADESDPQGAPHDMCAYGGFHIASSACSPGCDR